MFRDKQSKRSGMSLHRRPRVEELERRWVLSVTFVDSGQTLGDSRSFDVALGDLDSDGDLDALVLNEDVSEIWLNDGLGNFSDSRQEIGGPLDLGVATARKTVVLAEFDGDGDLDAIVNARGENEIWLNNGRGDFSDSGLRLTGGTVGIGDVNGDGTLDAVVVCGCFRIEQDHIWTNDGQGNFVDRQTLGNGRGYVVSLGDIDGDGDLDAFVASRSMFGPANEIWRNEGGVFVRDETAIHYVQVDTVGEDVNSEVELGDVDGDGDLDAFLTSGNLSIGGSDGIDKIWLNDGTGGFDIGFEGDSQDSRDVNLADLDGDGDLDAIVATSDDRNSVWINDGTGTFTVSALGNTDAKTTSLGLAVGDLDGDGDLDAFIANDGPNKVWLNQSVSAGDANRDGEFNQLDIVQVLASAKYLTGEPATWSEGDWNEDRFFDQEDIVAALQTGNYLQGPYGAVDAAFAGA